VSTSCGQGAELDEVMGEDATVGRMETQGLVRREQSTRDARADNAVLTDAGLKRYGEATPTHDISLRRYLFRLPRMHRPGRATTHHRRCRQPDDGPLVEHLTGNPSPAAASLSQRAELSRSVR
jgi:hypothetical protein